MAHEQKKRITASLPPHLATFIDDYQQRTGTSKSEIVALGLRALQEQLLAEEYAEYARSEEFVDLETGEDQLASRSEAVLKAIQALRDQQLAEDYVALARENDPERARFLEGNTDGLEASDGSEWL